MLELKMLLVIQCFTQHTRLCEDTFGNTDASQASSFSIPEPIPTRLVAIAALSMVIAGLGLIVCFRKKRLIQKRVRNIEVVKGSFELSAEFHTSFF
jgi:hypothetical protein